jgi:formylglycine-generating enzyme
MKLNRSVLLTILTLFPCAAAYGAITIDTVHVGNAGNPNDPATGLGRVNYDYGISKYEVTIGQYVAFLNAVAATDTYNLYNPFMATNLNIAGIAQSGASGSYTYSAIGSANRPVTYVGWGDAARFANWLHNGQPIGAQNANTTEDGAYTLNGANATTTLMAVVRNSAATWAIPTQNEWYKAAYYQPVAQGGDTDSYWNYPMKTNSKPYSDQPPGATPDNTRVANFYQNDFTANGYDDGYAVPGSPFSGDNQNMITDVGAYTASSSFYGTFDQGGNVKEWTETIDEEDSSMHTVSGGGYGGTFPGMESIIELSPDRYEPLYQVNTIGLRMIYIPEPTSATLCAAGVLILTVRRRWRHKSASN